MTDRNVVMGESNTAPQGQKFRTNHTLDVEPSITVFAIAKGWITFVPLFLNNPDLMHLGEFQHDMWNGYLLAYWPAHFLTFRMCMLLSRELGHVCWLSDLYGANPGHIASESLSNFRGWIFPLFDMVDQPYPLMKSAVKSNNIHNTRDISNWQTNP